MDTPRTKPQLSDEEWLAGQSAVGIAFSGGGIRAASFALGVAQTLQNRLGLIRGDRAARWLSCVSGGSYIAGAITLVNAGSRMRWLREDNQGATDLPEGASPYQPGSPELLYMQRHTRYLVEEGPVRTFVILGLTVIAGLVSTALVGVGGTALVLLLFGFFGWSFFGVLELPLGGAEAVLALILLFGAVISALGAERKSMWWRVPVILALVGACLATVPRFLVSMEEVALVLVPHWLSQNAGLVWAVTAGILIVIGAGLLLGLIRQLRILGRVALGLGGLLLRFVPILLILSAGIWLAALVVRDNAKWFAALDRVSESMGDPFWWLYIVGQAIVLTAIIMFFTFAPAHVVYRDRLAKCFAVIRTSGGAKAARNAETIHLSSLTPGPRVPLEELHRKRRLDDIGLKTPKTIPPEDAWARSLEEKRAAEDEAVRDEPAPPWMRYPELLVCAAANVSGAGAAPAGGNVLPFVLSGKALDLPTEGASLPMDVTERRESAQVGLASVMALSGAAVSPAMGRLTRQNYRTMLAVLGVRLGVWLPNPLSPAAHAKYKARTQAGSSRYGPFAFLGELLGVHPPQMPNIYVTDGGHDENLGLIELLRRGCSEIWAVDASTDRPGRAPALVQAVMSAEAELGCSIVLDLTVFDPDAEKGLHKRTFATGTVTYRDGRTAALHVVKLGLTSAHSSVLHEYAKVDTSFPYHSTLRQIYPATRFDAYRRLGNETTNFAIDEITAIR